MEGKMDMVLVSVEINGKIESTDISAETHEILRNGAYLRKRPLQWFLYATVMKYGSLTEENIKKYIDECLIF